MHRNTDTIEGAIDWLDRALRETRADLAAVDPVNLDNVSRAALLSLQVRTATIARGVTCTLFPKAVLDWHGIRVSTAEPDLELFDTWLAVARVTVLTPEGATK